MTASISNLNGEQQNRLHHLSKNLKKVLKPLAIICYGHRSTTVMQSSVCSDGGMTKKNSSVFDIFVLINDNETLPDDTLFEMVKRNCGKNVTEHMMIFRMKDVLFNLKERNRFFLSVFRKGILLYGNKDALKLLPNSFPPPSYITIKEKNELSALLLYAKRCLSDVENEIRDSSSDTKLNLITLNAAAVSILRYFIAGNCGVGMLEDFRGLLNYSAASSDLLKRIFPANTPEEVILLQLINLSFIDGGYSPGTEIICTLAKRISRMIAVSQSVVEQKLSALQLV